MVDLVLTTRPADRGGRGGESGIYDSTLGNCVRPHQDEQVAGSSISPDERARLVELEGEDAKLRVERVLLEQAVAFWVKEPPQ